MAVVYAAFDTEHGNRPVALKLQRELEPMTTLRFHREAEILSRISIRGVVGYIDHGSLPDGRVWLALEWLEGETLQQRLQRGPLPPDAAFFLAESVADSLGVLHAQGVVHRDIKPENLFLRRGDATAVCLLDLGIARLISTEPRQTRVGMVVGTPSYMAPEQARAAADLDHRADLYALGTVLYECLTGDQAWPGLNPLAVMVKLLVEPPPRLSAVRPDLGSEADLLLSELMSRAPEDRPSTAQEVAVRLKVVRLGLPEEVAQAARRPNAEVLARLAAPLAAEEVQIRTILLVGGAPAQSTLADALSDRWQARLDALLLDNGASVASLADGSMLLTFEGRGEPTDRAARAVRCALALAGHLPDAPLVVATGGLHVAGDGGTPRIGDVIDRATEVLRGTPHGTVRVDATTAGLLDAGFVLTEPLPGEGGERILLGEIEPLSRARLVRGRPSPFVGRERELLLLDGWRREVADRHRARVVVVHGPAGIGKTRLRDEALARFTSHCPEMLVISGSCPERGDYGSGLREALLRTLDVQPGDNRSRRFEKLEAWLRASLPAEPTTRTLPFLAELLGCAPYDSAPPALLAARNAPEEMAFALGRALADALLGPLAVVPVVLTLDDADHTNPGTLALLKVLVERLTGQPFLLLLLARSESVGLSLPGRAALPLRPLSDAAARRLVAATLDADSVTQGRLCAQAGGNPYFLEELVRAMAEARPGGEYGPDTVDGLPPVVLAMVQSRISGQKPLEKRVLRAASVLGREFGMTALRGLLPDLPTATLEGALRELVQSELLEAERGLWCFDQETVRAAAYAMLTPDDRREAHARAAAHCMDAAPDAPSRVAEHLVGAGRPVDAAPHFVAAAELSLARNDLEGASTLAERGLALLAGLEAQATDPVVGALHQILAHVAGWRGRRAELSVHAELALTRLPSESAAWMRALGDWITVQTSFDTLQVEHRLDTLLQNSRAPRTPALRAAAATALCRVAARISEKGATPKAEALFRAAFELGRGPDLPPPAGAIVQRTLAVRAWRQGDTATAHAALSRALYELESLGFDRQAAGLRGNLGTACNELGLYDEAMALLDETVREAARLGLVRVEAAAWHNLGHTLLRIGRLDEAHDAESTALQHFESQGDALMTGAARVYLARILTYQGRAPEAESLARRAAMSLDGTAAPLYILAQAALAEALLAQGQATSAVAAAKAGAAAAEGLNGVGEGAVLLLLLWGEAAAATGDAATAAERFAEARALVEARAAQIQNPVMRRAWREAVSENAQSILRAEEFIP